MFIELVDALRCPAPHEESWLVVAAHRTVARHILDGILGCPVCSAQYEIIDGVVDFRRGDAAASSGSVSRDPDEAMRLAAFLGLDDAQGFAVLLGQWGSHALGLRGLVTCPIMLIDPPDDVDAAPGLSIIRTDGPLPLAIGAARGVAIDLSDTRGVNAERVASAVRTTRPTGRLVAPVALPLPPDVRELARDASVWVGERGAATSGLFNLHVRRGATRDG